MSGFLFDFLPKIMIVYNNRSNLTEDEAMTTKRYAVQIQSDGEEIWLLPDVLRKNNKDKAGMSEPQMMDAKTAGEIMLLCAHRKPVLHQLGPAI